MKKSILIFSMAVALITASCKKTEVGPAGEDGKDGISLVTTETFNNVAITQTVGAGFKYVELQVSGLAFDETVIVTAQQSVSTYTANPGNANTDTWSSMPFYINGTSNNYLTYKIMQGAIRINVTGTEYDGDRFNFKISRLK